MLIMLVGMLASNAKTNHPILLRAYLTKMTPKEYLLILFPILINEFLWSLGENVYAVIYGHLGTDSVAAMTLTNPIQGLMIGALSGLAGAAGVIVGKQLGSKSYDRAYSDAKKLLILGFAGAIVLSAILLTMRGFYVEIYRVDDWVKHTASQILVAFAILSPIKVLNMILGGGIIRSGGNTKIVMYIDLIGTWLFGVPLGFLSAYILGLPIPYVYFILSLEELIRLLISLIIFRQKKWMQNLS